MDVSKTLLHLLPSLCEEVYFFFEDFSCLYLSLSVYVSLIFFCIVSGLPVLGEWKGDGVIMEQHPENRNHFVGRAILPVSPLFIYHLYLRLCV